MWSPAAHAPAVEMTGMTTWKVSTSGHRKSFVSRAAPTTLPRTLAGSRQEVQPRSECGPPQIYLVENHGFWITHTEILPLQSCFVFILDYRVSESSVR